MTLLPRIFERPAVQNFIASLPRSNLRLTLLGLYHRHITANAPARLYVRPGEALAYIGFYRAEYAGELAECVGPDGRVILIEADPKNHAALVEGLKAVPRRDRIEVINRAIWRESGTVSFETYDDEGSVENNRIALTNAEAFYPKSEKVIDVPAVTFDEVFRDHPETTHVFVTINGAELEAIKGMDRYLSTPGRSAWIKSPFVEKGSGKPMIEQVAAALRRRGLRVFPCREPRMRDGTGKVFAYVPFR